MTSPTSPDVSLPCGCRVTKENVIYSCSTHQSNFPEHIPGDDGGFEFRPYSLVRVCADEIERLEYENSEMRRTFGSHPLFEEKDRKIERLRAALSGIVIQLTANGPHQTRDRLVLNIAREALQGTNDA